MELTDQWGKTEDKYVYIYEDNWKLSNESQEEKYI